MKRIFTTLITFLSIITGIDASVKVYTNPDKENGEGLISGFYKVEIIQNGNTQFSPVYNSKNPYESNLSVMTDFNHWTTFEFEGTIEIRITKNYGFIGDAKVYPLSRNIKPVIEGKTMSFSIDKPGKFYIEMANLEDNPLFIFADSHENFIPDPEDKDVIWFRGGEVYDIGEQFEVKSNQTVYIEGGAWVYGTIALEENAKNVKILGRGIISSVKLGRRSSARSIPFSTIFAPGTDGDVTIEGVTITDPAHFCIITYIKNVTSNVKLFGWWYQTDGWGGGNNSTFNDSFIKVNDDNVKVYHKNQKITNLVIYQQINGAPFQLSWGNHAAENSTVDGIDIVKSYVPYDSRPGNADMVNLRHHSNGNKISNLTFKNIRADQPLYSIFGINNDRGGDLEDIRFENIILKEGILSTPFIINTGKIKNISFKDVVIGNIPFSKKIIEASPQILEEIHIQ